MFSVQNTIAKSYGQEKIVCKKVKSSITKIGNLALGRIYCYKYDQFAESVRTFAVSKDEFDLTVLSGDKSSKSHQYGIRWCGGESYEVWGIKLGLKHLAQTGSTIFDEIVNAIKESKEVPSHFIKRTWSSDDYTGDQEHYTVYRLTQAQEQQLRTAVWQLELPQSW